MSERIQYELFTGFLARPGTPENRQRCTVCKRPIWSAESIRAGAGPFCRKMIDLKTIMERARLTHETIPGHPIRDGIVFERLADSRFATNVPWKYSTNGTLDGFETGYRGSGPTEFALNAVAALLESAGVEYSGKIGIASGEVGAEAFLLRTYWRDTIIDRVELERGDRYVLPYALALYCLDERAREKGAELGIRWDRIASKTELVEMYLEFDKRFPLANATP